MLKLTVWSSPCIRGIAADALNHFFMRRLNTEGRRVDVGFRHKNE